MEPKMGMTRYSVRRIFEIILRRWYWPLIFAAIFAIVFSYFFWTRYSSTYQVSSTFIPLSAQTNYYTAGALVKNDMVLDAVKNSIDFDTTISELEDAIDVEANQNSVAVTVNIIWDNRDEAMEILEALKANLTFAVTHSAQAGEIKWMDAASSGSGQPASSASRTYQIIILGALIGLAAGAVLSYFLGSIDKRVFEIEAVRYGSDVKAIGTIGKIKAISASGAHSKMPAIIERHNEQFVAAGLYLNKLMDTDGKKLVMCVAPTSKCGTSTIVRNIAKLLSGIKTDILIISVVKKSKIEHKEPKIHSIHPGVYEVALTLDESESYGSFFVKISKLLSVAENKFKLILVDCPALLENVQISMIAEGVDAALLVSRYGVTKYDEVSSAVSLLSRAGAKAIYSVWNFTDRKHSGFYPKEAVPDEGRVANGQP